MLGTLEDQQQHIKIVQITHFSTQQRTEITTKLGVWVVFLMWHKKILGYCFLTGYGH